MKIKVKKINILSLVLVLTCFFANISQLPILIESGNSKLVSNIGWIVLFFMIILSNNLRLGKNIMLVFALILNYMIFIFFMEIMNNGKYLNTSIFKPVIISIFVFTLGYFISNVIEEQDFKYIVVSYVISTFWVVVSVYLKIIPQFSWSNVEYAYASKNSISQIILTAIILLFMYIKSKKIWINISKWVLISFMTLVMLMLKSRASIIGLLIFILINLFFSKNKKSKIILLIIVGTFILISIFNDNFYNLILNDVLLGGRDKGNLNDISSGRFDMIIFFLKEFPRNIITGRGYYFIESFPLSILIQYGILGSLPLFIIALLPVTWSILNLKKNYSYNFILLNVSICYLINGLFESQAPFGPGIKNYFMWLFFGILLGKNHIINKSNLAN